MVDVSSAREQIAQARNQISTARQESESLKSENQTIQEKLNSAKSQILSPRNLRSGSNINSLLLRQKQFTAIGQTESQLSEREKAISEFESNISANEQAVNEYEMAIDDYEHRLEQESKQPQVTVEDVEQSLQMSLSPELRKKINDELKRSNYKYSDDLVNRLNNVLNERIKQPDIQTIEPLQVSSITEPSSVLTIPGERGIGRAEQYLSRKTSELQSKRLRGESLSIIEQGQNIFFSVAKAPVGLVSSIAGVPKLATTLIKEPKNLFLIKQSLNAMPSSVGQSVRENPIGTTSRLAGELLLLKGVSSVSKAVPKSLGYPKFSTVVRSIPTEKPNIFNFVADTKQKNLLNNRYFMTVGKADVRSTALSESRSLVASDVKGLMRESTMALPSGRRQFTKRFYVGSRDVSIIDRTPVNAKLNNLASQEIPESFTIQTVGVSRSKRLIRGIDTDIKSGKYVSAGVGGQYNQDTMFMLSKQVPYATAKNGKKVFSRSGQGYTLGYFKKDVPETTTIIQSGKGLVQKKTMSPLVQEQIKQNIESTLKSQPSVTPILTNTAGSGIKTISVKAETKPQVVAQSMFYGTGTYEKTSESISPMLKSNSLTRTYDVQSDILKSSSTQSQASEQKSRLKEIQDNIMGLRQPSKFNDSFRYKQLQGQAQAQDQPQALKQSTKQIPKVNERNRIGLFFASYPKSSNQPKAKLSGIRARLFRIFQRRKGVDRLIGTESSLDLANKRLKNVLKSDLSASGFIESEGEKVNAKSLLGFGNEFGTSKKDYFRLVQKRGFRLGSYPERKEIQFFRKRKKKKGWFD